MDGHEPVMEWQATKERISIEKRMKFKKPYIPKHLRREAHKVELDGFHKWVKRVPKDMYFEVAYHKYRLNPAPTADSNREPAKPGLASVDIQISASVDTQLLESIDTKLSALVDTLQISEQAETEKSKSGGKTRKRKKKKNVDADFLSLVPSQFQEGSLEYIVRCRGGPEPFTKIRVLCDSELRLKGEASPRAFIWGLRLRWSQIWCEGNDKGDFLLSESASQEVGGLDPFLNLFQWVWRYHGGDWFSLVDACQGLLSLGVVARGLLALVAARVEPRGYERRDGQNIPRSELTFFTDDITLSTAAWSCVRGSSCCLSIQSRHCCVGDVVPLGYS
ncbi:hypothetical protein F2Q68_00004359 [Brassica cretica]|uniref:Uncharacterized protein n=1 Tax=Brassica cretica TaxID=69181 RepID=A0A8S9JE96_BRACR|nr:hypothetical protein F2Q68_00004359 [Brassica cretica]